jgi:hypothetical protein
MAVTSARATRNRRSCARNPTEPHRGDVIAPDITPFHVKHRPLAAIPASSREAVSDAYRAP